MRTETLDALGAALTSLRERIADLERKEFTSVGGGGTIFNPTARGDMIAANSTPAWARLALGGGSGAVLTRNATDPVWSSYNLAGSAGRTYTFPDLTGIVALLPAANIFTNYNEIQNYLDMSGGRVIVRAESNYLAGHSGGVETAYYPLLAVGQIECLRRNGPIGSPNLHLPLYIGGDPIYINVDTGAPGTTIATFSMSGLQCTQFSSTVAFGTQPYACNSVTLNTNLNADLLDGYHASGLIAALAGSAQYQVLTTGAGPGYAAAWSDFYLRGTAGGTTSFAVTNAKTLTLTATDSYNLTIPKTGSAIVGTGAATRLSYFSDANELTSDARFVITDNSLKSLSGATIMAAGGAGAPTTPITGIGFAAYHGFSITYVMSYDFASNIYYPMRLNAGPLYLNQDSGQYIQSNFSDAGTTNVANIRYFDRTSSDTPAAGFGSQINFRLKSSTTIEQIATSISALWTTATHASRNSRAQIETYTAGNVIGHSAHWAGTAIDGTSQTIIANGTGDVTECITILYSAAEITGTDTGGGVVTLEPSDTFNLCSDGTNILTITCAADGSLTIARSAGTDTFKVSLWMTWL